MKQYLHTIMRSLCIMVMLCGISTSAWAQEDTPAYQWAVALGLESEYTEETGTSDSYPLVINDGYWDTFVQYVTTTNGTEISTEGLYFQLGTSITIDEGWSPISGFDGYFDGNYNTVNMPSGNILTLPTSLFENEPDNSNISNISYSFSEIIINDAAGLQELRTKVSSWTEISTSYTIDLRDGDIVIDGSSWNPIDDYSSSFTMNYVTDTDNPHFIVFNFPDGYSANDLANNTIYLQTSTSSIETQYWRYNYLTVSQLSDFDAWAGYSDLVAATLKLQLLKNLDYASTSIPSNCPLDYTGEFDQNGYYIYYPAPIISDATPLLFDPEYVQGEVVYTPTGPLQITSESDFATFTSDQDYWYGVSGGSIEIQSNISLSDFYTPVQSRFTVKGASNITVADSSNLLEMANYRPVFENEEDNGSVTYNLVINDAADFEKLTNSSFDSSDNITLSSDYDTYDLTDITLGSNTSNSVKVESNVKFFIPDKWNCVPFSANGEDYITTYHSPSCYLVDKLYNGALFDPSMRKEEYKEGDKTFTNYVDTHAGSGTESSPYLIYNYEMLKEFVTFVNQKDEDYTSGMYVKLMSDINVQGNERLTDINGNTTNTTPTIQFSNFKGHFIGNYHSIGGLTCPLFANLNGATIENLGIVDCKMVGHALAASATHSTVTMSYVSGVSLGLISQTNNTVTNCYAYNTSTKATTTYNITAETTPDASGTHDILVGNCYTLYPIGDGDNIKTDCTLFIPEDNNIYKYDNSKSDDLYTDLKSYIDYSSEYWIDNPMKSNVNMLHNVLYMKSGARSDTENSDYKWRTQRLNYLYSWYIVDKAPLPTFGDDDMLSAKLNNIYYSRNNTSTSLPAPDGLNTIYLPFAWNPATDVYYSNGTPMGDDVEVYILADKLNDDAFDDDAKYKDYSTEKSLLFFKPSNSDFSEVSNALPTILKIPEGANGWYIKRNGEESNNAYYCKFFGDGEGIPNLYNRYWEGSYDGTDITNDFEDYADVKAKRGRSFMEIGRLGEEWNNYDSKDSYTYKYYHSLDDMSNCSENQVQITEMNRDEKEVYDSGSYSKVTIYKAPESNAIAVDGETYPIKIYVEDENGSYNDLKYETNGNDRIVIDGEGKPTILYKKDTQEKIVIDYYSETIEVCSSDGNGGYESPTGNTISVDIDESCYPLSNGFYVCGGHEDGSWASQDGVSDFPGRAYHLGTFTGIAKNTFADGKYNDYSCYKLNSAGTGFAKVTSGSTVQPFRTFFAIAKGVGDIDTGTPSEAKAYRFGFCGIYDGSESGATEIDGVATEGIKLMTTDESKVYSLDGRYVGQYGNKKLAPGMYIMNGKKFVVK